MLGRMVGDGGPPPAVRRRLHPSGAAEPDRDRALVSEDHGDLARAAGQLQHALQPGGILLHVDVLERDMPPFEIFTGG